MCLWARIVGNHSWLTIAVFPILIGKVATKDKTSKVATHTMQAYNILSLS